MAANTVCISKRLAIGGGASSSPWFPVDVCSDGEVETIKLRAREYGLQKFVGNGFDGSFIEWLKLERYVACMNIEKGSSGLFDDTVGDESLYAKSQKRRKCVEKHATGDIPQLIDIKVPDLTLDCGATVAGISIKCNTCFERHGSVWVECSETVLNYVRYALGIKWNQPAAAGASDDALTIKNTANVRWKSERGVFVAKRIVAETQKCEYKSFRPDDDSSPESRVRANEAARGWINELCTENNIV